MHGNDYIEHHGIKGQRWGLRRYQNPDGSLTDLGRKRLGFGTKSSKKATKGLNKLSTKELKGLIEKTKLAEELKDLQRKGKSAARSARMEKVKDVLNFRNDLRTKKLEKKSKIAQEKIRKEQAEDDAKNEKRRKSADKWKHRGTKWTNMVKVSKALKVFGNDMGITKKENGETVIGDAAKFFKKAFKDAGIGKKDKSFDIDDKKDWDVDSAKDYGDFDVGNKTQKAAKNVANAVNRVMNSETVTEAAKENAKETMATARDYNKTIGGLFSFATSEHEHHIVGNKNKFYGIVGPDAFKNFQTRHIADAKNESALSAFKIEDLGRELTDFKAPKIRKTLLMPTAKYEKDLESSRQQILEAAKSIHTTDILRDSSRPSTLSMPVVNKAVSELPKVLETKTAEIKKENKSNNWFQFKPGSTLGLGSMKLDEVPFITIGSGAGAFPIPIFGDAKSSGSYKGAGSALDIINNANAMRPDIRNKLQKVKGFGHSEDNEGMTFADMLITVSRAEDDDDYIEHHGIKNQKWGVRRYQNPDGSLTELGKRHRNAAEEALTEKVRNSGANAGSMWYQYVSARRRNKIAKSALRRRKLRDAVIHPFKTIKGQDTEKAKEIRRERDNSAAVRDISINEYKKYIEEGQLANKTLQELRKLKKKDKAVS